MDVKREAEGGKRGLRDEKGLGAEGRTVSQRETSD